MISFMHEKEQVLPHECPYLKGCETRCPDDWSNCRQYISIEKVIDREVRGSTTWKRVFRGEARYDDFAALIRHTLGLDISSIFKY